MPSEHRKELEKIHCYLAGFFDGEGCIAIKRDKRRAGSYFPTIDATNTETEPLELLQILFGGSLTMQNRHTPSRQDIFYWRLGGRKNITIFLETLIPYLIIKKTKAELVLQYYREFKPMGREQEGKAAYFELFRILNGSSGEAKDRVHKALKLVGAG